MELPCYTVAIYIVPWAYIFAYSYKICTFPKLTKTNLLAFDLWKEGVGGWT